VPSIGVAGLVAGTVMTGTVFGLTPAATAAPAGATTADAGGRYIVSFADAATAEQVADARNRAVAAGAQIRYDYDTALAGFAALLPEAARADLEADPAVAEVEPDEVMSIETVGRSTQTGVTDGLDRIDQRGRKLNGKFRYTSTGSGVVAYVIDTGVYAGHSEFGGRVRAGRSFTGAPATSDCGEGHGTHVAGLIGGTHYGVAKNVTIVPVKVFSCTGSACVSTVFAGIEWATEAHRARGGPAVINLSAGVDKGMGAGLELAARNAIRAGITFVTAAGNEGSNACAQSPARLGPAITVGAVNGADRMAGFSNSGRCVDLFAPGVNVLSAGIESSTDTAKKDGTSMAAPYVTGVVASFLERAPQATPSQVRSALMDATTKGDLRGLTSGSPNKLLFNRLQVINRAPHVSAPRVSMPRTGSAVRTDSVPIRVSWKGSDPDGSVRSYQLQRSTDGGKHWSSVTLPRPTVRSVTLNQRPGSALRFRVRVTDNFGKRSAFAKGAKMRLVLDQQGTATLRRTWSRTTGADLSGGSAQSSGIAKASATYTFGGGTVRWIGTTGADHGKAKVYLDGRLVDVVDTYSATRRTCVVLFAKALKPGRHTMRIVVLGKKNKRATGDRVDVDAFVVSS
jgi:subtilisin family serine protease